MADDFASFSRKMNRLSDELSGRGLDKLTTKIGVAAKKDAADALRGDIGDESLSNWRPGRPISMRTRFVVKGGTIELTPQGRAIGPWTVLHRGRRAGISRRGRRYGGSSGRGTWSDVERLVAQRTPKRVADEVNAGLRRALRG
jgi:hypothetical protein